MAFRTFSVKRPNDSRVYGNDLINQLGDNEQITSVSATITLKDGVVDPNIGTMIVGIVYFQGRKVWARVQGGLSGNYYFLTFIVNTTSQGPLEYTNVIPVSSGV